MNWYLSAIVSAVALAAQFLCMKRLQESYSINVYMAYIWMGAAILLMLFFVRPAELHIIADNVLLLLVAAFASWGGMYSYNLAIVQQTNLGYVEALSSTRLAIVYCVSLLFFGATIEVIKLLAVLAVFVGLIMVIWPRNSGSQDGGKKWVVWALLSAVMFALLAICIKLVTSRGLDAPTATAVILFIAGLIFIGTAVQSRANLKPSSDMLLLGLAIVFATAGNLTLFMSYNGAPNLAYPVAISNSRSILLYLVALAVRADTLEVPKAIGVVLAFVGIALLS